ncbi:hypothetical protein L6R53_14030 [Myxococcota bacterium]|nr:hypothetical protein [Myxococcota bacterium]
MSDDLQGLGLEAGTAALCGACLEASGVPGQFAVPLGAALAVSVRWALQTGLPALAAWWAHRRVRPPQPPGSSAPPASSSGT